MTWVIYLLIVLSCELGLGVLVGSFIAAGSGEPNIEGEGIDQ